MLFIVLNENKLKLTVVVQIRKQNKIITASCCSRTSIPSKSPKSLRFSSLVCTKIDKISPLYNLLLSNAPLNYLGNIQFPDTLERYIYHQESIPVFVSESIAVGLVLLHLHMYSAWILICSQQCLCWWFFFKLFFQFFGIFLWKKFVQT